MGDRLQSPDKELQNRGGGAVSEPMIPVFEWCKTPTVARAASYFR